MQYRIQAQTITLVMQNRLEKGLKNTSTMKVQLNDNRILQNVLYEHILYCKTTNNAITMQKLSLPNSPFTEKSVNNRIVKSINNFLIRQWRKTCPNFRPTFELLEQVFAHLT